MAITILIAAEHIPILYGLKALTQSVLGTDSIVVTVSTLGSLTIQLEQTKYDILITDIMLDGKDISKTIEDTLLKYPAIKIVVVSLKSNLFFVQRALEAGAQGYINISGSESDFKTAIKAVVLGKKYIPQELKIELGQKDAHIKPSSNPFVTLSSQEYAVLQHLLNGSGIKDTSLLLNLKITTISTYRSRIFKKLHVNNLLELAQLAKIFNIHPEKDASSQ